MNRRKKIYVTVNEDIHNQIISYFEAQGEKFNLSEAVQDIEKGLLQGLIKHQKTVGIVAPLLRAKTMAGLIIGDAFQSLFSEIEKTPKQDV
jgi:hypothetical protein